MVALILQHGRRGQKDQGLRSVSAIYPVQSHHELYDAVSQNTQMLPHSKTHTLTHTQAHVHTHVRVQTHKLTS